VDGGDASVWSGPDKAVYVDRINKIITDRVCEIYSAFALCDELDIDLGSSSVDEQIDEYIRHSVEGGDGVVGYGSYEEYLAKLKEFNLNYSTQVLLYRYAIAVDLINDYYIGTFDADEITEDKISVGKLQYERKNVEEFYFGDGCVRVLRAFIDPSNYYEHQVSEKIEKIHSLIVEAAGYGEERVAAVMIGNTTMAGSEIENGYVIAEHNLDAAYYGGLTEAAFELAVGEVSEPVYVNDGEIEAYCILYRTEKSDAHFEECYADIAYVFLTNEVGRYLDDYSTRLGTSAMLTELYDEIDHATVSMGE
jgi:hypothetical protein